MNEKPFDHYSLEIDEDAEEIHIEAWDDEAPTDVFHARLPLFVVQQMLRRFGRELSRA